MDPTKRPDKPSSCTWKVHATDGISPHTEQPEASSRRKILPDILSTIGQTPLIRLNKIPKSHGVECEMVAKCEFFNPGGSVKDRIGYRMVLDAEEKSLIKPGYTIIEPTSGNTGIGLALASAVHGYKCIIVMPEKMSNEKVYVLEALGAKIIRTPNGVDWTHPKSHVSIAHELQKKIPNSVVLDQYTNPGNPLAHYDRTATELWEQCDGKIDVVVVGAGTGGTITGIGRKLKELSPVTRVIGVDPKGSILAQPPELNEDDVTFYEVEGIGYDFVPTVLDRNVVDEWVKTEDCESLNMARKLIREEGLLCGGSSGAALTAALRVAKDLPADKRVVVILPDGIRNYMTKFVSDRWMEVRGFLPSEPLTDANKWWWTMPVSNLALRMPVMPKGMTCQSAVSYFKINPNCQQLLVTDTEGTHVEGVVTSDTLMSGLISGTVNRTDCAESTAVKQFARVKATTTLGKLSRILETESYAVVLNDDDGLAGCVNQNDLLNFITKADDKVQSNGIV